MRLPILCGVVAFTTLAKTEDRTLTIPPVSASIDVKGQTVKVAVWGTVASAPADRVKFDLMGDLSDLQQNITPVLAAQMNRSDRCGERLSVERAAIAPASPAAILTVTVHYERWACIKALGKIGRASCRERV